jgi:hypothetical protein
MLNYRRPEVGMLKTKDNPRKFIEDWLNLNESNALFADGFDQAIIGLSLDNPKDPIRVIYDYDKCIAILKDRDKMDDSEAAEFFSFNVVGAWVGEGTPLFVLSNDLIQEYAESF